MKYAIVYSSRTGNTALLAEALKEGLPQEDCLFFGTEQEAAAKKEKLQDASLVFAGFWTDKGDCTESMAAFLEELKGKRVFLFGTAGFGESASYFSRILEKVKRHLGPGCEAADGWMCQGRMPEAVRRRYEAMEDAEQARRLIANFDAALSHPDSRDLENLKQRAGRLFTGTSPV